MESSEQQPPIIDPQTPLVNTSSSEDDCQCDRRKICSCRSKTIAGICLLVVIALITILILYSKKHRSTTNDELDEEKEFMNSIFSNNIKMSSKYYTNNSHMAGTEWDYATALYTQAKLIEYGIPDVSIEEMDVLLSYPINRTLQIISPDGSVNFTAALKEAVVSNDPSSGKPSVQTFLAYSASGDVQGELVYANYGSLQDFKTLIQNGINVTGKIVIMRYGDVYRGNKIFNAEQFGAIGAIIYSDPIDDGFWKGETFPDGPWRSATGVQRGSIWNGNGDPLTPGYPSVNFAPRISIQEAHQKKNSFGTPLSNIPSLPISWSDALPLLTGLRVNPIPEESWQGGLNFSYHIGPGPVVVRLTVYMNNTVTKIWNVIGKIEGSDEPDRIVLMGNHRDAWTFGAGDPSSGTAILLGVAEGLGHLLSRGWLPKRSIWLCSWDAEEFALIGSVEFCEKHGHKLFQQAIAYLNVDIGVSGASNKMLSLVGVPSLTNLMLDITQMIPFSSNGTSQTLYDLWSVWYNLTCAPLCYSTPLLNANLMGTGSDYGGFLQHLGIASMDMRFTSIPDAYAGVYHSNYDDYYWMTHFGDSKFDYHAAISKLWGVAAIRIANSMILPFSYQKYAVLLANNVDQMENISISQSLPLKFHTLKSALREMIAVTNELERNLTSSEFVSKLTEKPMKTRSFNDRLFLAERTLLFLQGFKEREWYRHVIWVNGEYDGYSSTSFSAILDAITVGDYSTAQFQIQIAAIVIQEFSRFILGQ